jgi:hypothetical protein
MKRREMLIAAIAVAPLKVEAQEEDLVALARKSMKANREAIEKVKLPMATEPAFSFKA